MIGFLFPGAGVHRTNHPVDQKFGDIDILALFTSSISKKSYVYGTTFRETCDDS